MDFKPSKVNAYNRVSFDIKYNCRCISCDTRLLEGDKASYSKNEPGQIICLPCAEEEDAE